MHVKYYFFINPSIIILFKGCWLVFNNSNDFQTYKCIKLGMGIFPDLFPVLEILLEVFGKIS